MARKLCVCNIYKSFETQNGRRQVLDNVSFELEEGSCTVLGGENGSGKSVLMNIIAGLEEADFGVVKSFGRAGLVFQEADTQILGETVFEDVCFGPKNLGWKKEKVLQAAQQALKKTGLSEKKDFPARFLSGGEKRRLSVACMLAMDFPIIIMDEPHANLDYMGIKQVNELIKDLKAQGKTVIVLSHEIEKCLGLADRFLVLFRGMLVFDGKPEQAFEDGIDIEKWNIKNPFNSYRTVSDLVWK